MTGVGEEEEEEEEGCDFRAEIKADVANSVAVGDRGTMGEAFGLFPFLNLKQSVACMNIGINVFPLFLKKKKNLFKGSWEP